jgi:fibronectin type 3 domain-containing protein
MLGGASGSAVSVVLTAARSPQARILNPGPPTGLTATAGHGQVSLSWKAPASDGGAAITGYDVYLGTSSHGESASPVNSLLITGTSYPVTGLANGTTYYFTAVAVNRANLRSVASAEASATPVTAPGAPGGLTATAGDAQVRLSWRAPGSDGGAQITSYNVYDWTSRTITGKPVASVKGTSVTVPKLANGTIYYFKVTAVNKAGEGPASGLASATPAAAITQPGPPTRLTATPGDGQVTLTWTAPASDGGAAISGYLVYRGTSPGGESGVPVNGAPVQGTSYMLSGLRNGTRYYFTVAAVNGAKRQGNQSGEASATPVSAAASASASASASPSASAWASPSASAWASPSASASASPSVGAGTVGAPGASGHASAGSAGKAVLTSKKIPTPVIVSLAAVALGATAGAMTLTARRLRLRRHPPLPPPQDVRAVPDQGPRRPVSIHEIGADETYTVRLEPLPAAIITTIEELRL